MIYIAEILQETNCFNPVPTTLDSFKASRLDQGRSLLSNSNGKWAMDGFVRALKENGLLESVIPVISAHAISGGKITDGCLSYFEEVLTAAFQTVRHGDSLLLSLHGAMASESVDTAEGYLLHRIRQQVGRQVPIVLVLDHHANVTKQIVESVDLVVGYETQPHLPYAAGEKGARLLLKMLADRSVPATAWRKIPMIAPQDNFLTTRDGPMKEWFDLARQYETQDGVLSVSPFPMQPWLDAEEGGWSVVVHTDRKQALAETIADAMADKAWALRAEFWKSSRLSVADTISQADRQAEGLVVISDTGDAVLAGSFGDGTHLLREMIRRNIRQRAYVPLVDAKAVSDAQRAGVGAEVTLNLGAGIDLKYNTPVTATGVIRAVKTDVKVDISWGHCDLGGMALLQCGNVFIALLERPNFAINDPIIYTVLGLKMEDCRMVVLKTGSNFQGVSRWQTKLLRADTAGISQSTLKDFSWRHLPRPIYPLDQDATWSRAT